MGSDPEVVPVDHHGLGELLRAHRERGLLTQEGLAERAGLSARTIRAIEAGRVRRPHGTSLRLLADALGLSDQDRAALAGTRSGGAGGVIHATAAQLPMDAVGFTGRAGSLSRLDGFLPSDDGAPSALVIAAIVGSAGVGKTALAVHWAHRVAARFPDGQLFVNLDGFALGSPLRPVQALARLLLGLGVAADAVPVDVEEAAGLYRSLMAGKRMLVVLDNARSAEQVRPLVPGSPRSLVVVTSRDRLSGLVATHGARQLALDVFTQPEAIDLLTRILGEDRTGAEVEATARLAELCAGVPLALRIAAANVDSQAGMSAQPVAAYVARLRGQDGLAELEVAGDHSNAVCTAFDSSYEALESDTRRLFRLLGLVSGQDVTPPAAGALAGMAPERAARLLQQLAGAHLVEPRASGGFGLHDLLRRYAHQRALETDDEDARVQAVERLLGWYVHTADAAATRLYPGTLRLPVPPIAGSSPSGFADHAEALAWLNAERANLVAAVGYATEHGPHAAAWLLADVLHGYFTHNRHMVDWLAVANAARTAAQAEGDARAEAAAQRNLGRVHQALGDYTQAAAQYTSALELARRARWVEGEAAILVAIGMTDQDQGWLRRAADHHTRALILFREANAMGGQAIAMGNLGQVTHEMGCLEQAADHTTDALMLYREIASKGGEAAALTTLAEVDRDRGRLDDAHRHLLRSMALTRDIGYRYGEARALYVLATVQRDAGRHDHACEAAQHALDMARHIRDPRIQADALNTLGSVHLGRGDGLEAIERHRQALDLARSTKASAPEIDAVLGLAAAHTHLGEHSRAILHARQALDLAHRAGYRTWEAHAHVTLAATYLALDHHGRAAEHARQALDIHDQTGHLLGRARALVALGHALHGTDDCSAAWARWQEARTLVDDGHRVRALLNHVPVPPALLVPHRCVAGV
jgi:tetratricopeptide (TPR) repeat protein/transcriptional regulator with XRE-family HTH domain